MKTRLVTIASSELIGVAGLEDCFLTSMKGVGIAQAMLREIFTSVTTDGESANTGRNTGLWKRLEDNVGHKLITFWCACNHSDLGKIWKPMFLS